MSLRSNGHGPMYGRDIPDYILDGQDVRRLKRLSVRLYDGTVMTYDERRQLAAVIEAIIDRAVPNSKPEETWLL